MEKIINICKRNPSDRAEDVIPFPLFPLINLPQNLWSIALEKLINESKLNKQMNQHFINPINHLFIEVAKYLNIEDFGKVF